MDLSILLVK